MKWPTKCSVVRVSRCSLAMWRGWISNNWVVWGDMENVKSIIGKLLHYKLRKSFKTNNLPYICYLVWCVGTIAMGKKPFKKCKCNLRICYTMYITKQGLKVYYLLPCTKITVLSRLFLCCVHCLDGLNYIHLVSLPKNYGNLKKVIYIWMDLNLSLNLSHLDETGLRSLAIIG